MKKIVYFVLILTVPLFLHAQDSREKSFLNTVNGVVNAFSRCDNALANQYIKKDQGVYLLYRIGVLDNFTNYKKIDFADSSYPSILFSFSKGIKNEGLRYGKLPVFDCENWSKSGFFTDTTVTDSLLSNFCRDRNRWGLDSVPLSQIRSFENLEKVSRRIVMIDKQGRELIFYLSYIDRKWYLTIVDHVTTDCSV